MSIDQEMSIDQRMLDCLLREHRAGEQDIKSFSRISRY